MAQNKTGKTLYVEYTQISDRAHIKHKGTRHSFKNSIRSSNSMLAMADSKLTRSFHNLDPGYEKDHSPLLVVFRLDWICLCDLVSYVVLLNLNRSWRHSVFIWWIDWYVSIINKFSVCKSKDYDPFLRSSSSYMCHGVCEAIVLGSFPISDYSFFQKSALLMGSIQSCFLWSYWERFF